MAYKIILYKLLIDINKIKKKHFNKYLKHFFCIFEQKCLVLIIDDQGQEVKKKKNNENVYTISL